MRNLIHLIASDFSAEFATRFNFSEPADGYYDPLVKVLGRTPSEEDARAVLEVGIPRLTRELNKWLEMEWDETIVRDIYSQSLRNSFGSV